MVFNMPPPGSLLFKPMIPAPTIQLNRLDKFTLETLSIVPEDTPSEVDPITASTLHKVLQLNNYIFDTQLAG